VKLAEDLAALCAARVEKIRLTTHYYSRLSQRIFIASGWPGKKGHGSLLGNWAAAWCRALLYGPDQSKGMCLLDLPSHSHSKPKASTRSAVALPQVATVPDGPTSLPGG
jgi:hypothetical protein